MEQKVKEIVATFIKVPAEQIGPATAIDRSAVQSSILLHRMYARLAEEGLVVDNYATIKVFGDLSNNSSSRQLIGTEPALPVTANPVSGILPATAGIDIEEIAALPRTTDFRKDEFYKMNFTAGEMAYCILQPDPFASFAGLFAAKEAIIKASGSTTNNGFNTIEISHSPEGRPLHPDYAISISHAGGMAVAIAVRLSGNATAPALHPAHVPLVAPDLTKSGTTSWMTWIALLFSVLALLIVLLH